MPSSNKKPFRETCEYYFQRFGSLNYNLDEQIDLGTEIIVVIPSINETELTKTLSSLSQCDEPHCKTLVIVVVNASEKAPDGVKEQNDIALRR